MTYQNDRELLELAAKAAGIDLNWDVTPRTNVSHPQPANLDGGTWDPLNQDGDAVRLAVRLGLVIDPGGPTRCFASVRTPGLNWREFRGHYECDYPDSAVRRAIVRAAAEIGRSMK